jgi:hypothetical protein
MNGKERIKMGNRVWLDDIRKMPEGFDIAVKNAYFLIGMITSGCVDYISFDHDLGFYDNEIAEDSKNTGYAVACFIEYIATDEKIPVKRIGWDIHSANPVGRFRIEQAMKSAERIWHEREIGIKNT